MQKNTSPVYAAVIYMSRGVQASSFQAVVLAMLGVFEKFSFLLGGDCGHVGPFSDQFGSLVFQSRPYRLIFFTLQGFWAASNGSNQERGFRRLRKSEV